MERVTGCKEESDKFSLKRGGVGGRVISMDHWRMPRKLSWVFGSLALAGVYFCTGKAGLSLAFVNASATSVWPPSALALVALLLWGLRLWPGVLLGVFLLDITTQGSVAVTLGIAAGNTLEALAAAWLARRYAGGARAFERTQTVFVFVALAGLVSPAISATFGVTSLTWDGLVRSSQYGVVWLTWWLGDAVSILVLAPLLLIWKTQGTAGWTRRELLEGVAVLITTVVTGFIVFPVNTLPGSLGSLEWLTVPPILWAAFRFGPRGAATAVVLISSIAVVSTLQGLGPFGSRNPNQALLLLVSFMGIVSVTALALAAAVAERKRAELAVQEAGQRKDAILRSALDAILTIDYEGRLVEFNPAAEKVFGYARSAVLGKPMADLIIPERLRNAHDRGLAHYLATGDGPVLEKPIELPARRADGTEFLAELAIIPIRELRMFTAFVRDITERKSAERALAKAHEQLARHSEDLENMVSERTRQLRETIGELEAFSYSLSHDLRAPLRAIHGFTAIILEEFGGQLGRQGTETLQRVIDAAERLDRLILDVLTLTRLSRQEITLARIDVQKLVRDLISERPEFQLPGANIKIQGELIPMRGHEASLTQCITNLLANAVKFVAPGVQPRVRVSSERIGDLVRLWIEDNGIGIEVGQNQRIFEIFQRLHTDKAYPGTGIGLSIVRKAAERMGGKAGVESTPGGGSRFWIELKQVDDALR